MTVTARNDDSQAKAMGNSVPCELLLRGSLLPLGCAAPPKPLLAYRQTLRVNQVYDGCAAEREQAPSPQ